MDYPLSRAVELDLYSGKFSDGVPGDHPPSVIPSQTTNDILDELLALIAYAGLTKNETVKTQVRDSIVALIEARVGDYSLDTGTANAYVVAQNPAVVVNSNGMQVKFRVAHANTAASTLNAGGGVKPLVNDVGSALVSGDLPLGVIVSATFDSTADAWIINNVVTSQTLSQTAGDARYAKLAGLSTQAFATAALTSAADGQARGIGPATGTREFYDLFANFAGGSKFGLEGSAGGAILTGTAAYDVVLDLIASSLNFVIGSLGTKWATFNASGLVVNGSVTGTNLIGQSQSLVDEVGAGRSTLGTTYTNSTGRAIVLFISQASGTGGSGLNYFINGTNIGASTSLGTEQNFVVLVIHPGWTYKFTAISSGFIGALFAMR